MMSNSAASQSVNHPSGIALYEQLLNELYGPYYRAA
jgi:hypothetical protein